MNKDHQIWVDYIRVVATLCVIFLHASAPLLDRYNDIPITNWWIGNIYDSVMRICVPLFLLISGYLLLDKNENMIIFFKKRFHKVIVPLLAWSIIYIFWKHYYESSAPLSAFSFYSIILSPTYYHLWFLYTIIGIYLFMPILRIITKHADKQMLIYYVLLWFFSVSLVPLIEMFTGLNSKIDLYSISGFSGYFVVGFLLGKYTASNRVAMISIFTFLLCVGFTTFSTYLFTIRNEGKFYGYFYGYLTPNVILMSGSAFVALKHFVENRVMFRNARVLVIIYSLSSASLGIYLIHTIFLYLLAKGFFGITLSALIGNPILTIPATAVTTFFLSYLSIIVIKNIPILNRITP